ncbi:MAG: transport system, ATP-bidning protein [Gammaproteobacteria bacterium]|nr:transport system, ATP-bidning protein [Gammaproteobacteria bacterium]
MSLLRLEHLHKIFGELVVTNDVTLSVAPGERHAIIGPNGAGKTSLINQIAGQLRPTRGRIFLRDAELTGRSPDAVARLGVSRTFQRNTLFPSLTVLENVRLAVELRHGNPLNCVRPVARRTDVSQRALDVLHMVQLEDRAAREVSHLSYGEQRQLEVAIALAGDPALLLLDEPTSGMSQTETERMIELIGTLPSSLTVVLIEHDMNVVFSVADRVTVLYYGEVLATGLPAEIRENQRVHEVYLGAVH